MRLRRLAPAMFSKKTSVEGTWEDNSGYCTTCVRPFTLLRRAHHCRSCGRVFCNTCSQHRLLLPISRSGKSARVCTPCFNAGSGPIGGSSGGGFYGDQRFSFSSAVGETRGGGGGGGAGSFSASAASGGSGSSGGGGGGGGAAPSASAGGSLRLSRGASLDEGSARRQSAFASFSGAPSAPPQHTLPPHMRGFVKEGVTLEGMRAWITSRGGAEAFREQTTADVVTRHVLPSTSPGSALWAVLPLYHTGPATVHVCHAWGGRFLKILAALEAWEGENTARGLLPAPPKYWLDCFSLPLHTPASHSWEFLRENFAAGVAGIGKTVLVLDPEQPLPLRRTWCLFELAAALSEAPIDIALAPADAAKLQRSLAASGGLEAAAARLLAPIDIPGSEAGRSEDKRRLLRALREGGGSGAQLLAPEAAAAAVRAALAAWLLAACQKPLDAATSAIARAPLAAAVARVKLRVLQEHCGAEEALRDVLGTIEPILGDAHPRTIAVRQDLGAACLAQGKVQEAEGFLREALAGAAQAAALGGLGGGGGGGGEGGGEGGGGSEAASAEADCAAAQCSLAACLVAQGKLGEAELLLRQALNFRRASLTIGAAHRDTLEALLRLGQCLARAGAGRAGEAEPLLREAAEGARRALGEGAPLALEAVDSLGQFLAAAGDGEACEAFYAGALLARRRAIGDAHPATLLLLVALGGARHAAGDAVGALSCFQEALAAKDDGAKQALLQYCASLSAAGNLEDSERFLSLL